ncbi:MAG: hypothetical protein HC787_10455 [Nostocaceae cyanobacterium CSU_2_110]|nr:hypothetical protein [Nostocaceae cyanobacterium CSU_2_110]
MAQYEKKNNKHHYKTMEDLKQAINDINENMINPKFILSLCKFSYFFN